MNAGVSNLNIWDWKPFRKQNFIFLISAFLSSFKILKLKRLNHHTAINNQSPDLLKSLRPGVSLQRISAFLNVNFSVEQALCLSCISSQIAWGADDKHSLVPRTVFQICPRLKFVDFCYDNQKYKVHNIFPGIILHL